MATTASTWKSSRAPVTACGATAPRPSTPSSTRGSPSSSTNDGGRSGSRSSPPRRLPRLSQEGDDDVELGGVVPEIVNKRAVGALHRGIRDVERRHLAARDGG